MIIEKNSDKIQKQIELFEEIKQWALAHPTEFLTIIPIGSGEIFASHSGLKFLESLVDYPHRNLKIRLVSNGTLITKNLKILNKIHHLLTSIEISIDAATPDTYSVVRGGDWNALVDGLNFFRVLKTPLFFRYVVQKNNWHEIVDFAELAHEYKAGIYYSNLLDWGHWSIKWWHDNNVLDRQCEHYPQVLQQLSTVKNKYPGKINFSADIIRNLKK